MHRNSQTDLKGQLIEVKVMTNSQNMVKNHESSIKNANNAEQVGNILSNVENTPYALRGATVKTILYSLFSVIAAVELSAALFFYVASLGVPKAVAMVVCGVIAFGFHALLHSILTDTSKGIVFGKRTESGAMSNEVTANIVKKFEKKNYRHTYDSDECRTIAWETKHNRKFKKGAKA